MPSTATAVVATATAMAFAARTGVRVGTAASVERIIPVEYSPVISSAPSTAMVTMPSWNPPVTTSAPVRAASSGAVVGSAAMLSREKATASETPVMRSTVAPTVHQVDRSDSNLMTSRGGCRGRSGGRERWHVLVARVRWCRQRWSRSSVLPLRGGRCRGGEVGAVLDRVLGEAHVGLFEAGAAGAQLVEHDAVGEGDLADG